MERAKRQIEWVNIAKGLTMLMVVVGHISYALPNWELLPLPILLTSWHIYVFFLIGGFFLREERLQQPLGFIRGKFMRLYLPLMLFYIPAVLLHNVFLDIGFYDTVTDYGGKLMYYYSWGDLVKKLLLTIGLAGREPILGAMWFVYVLFMALCLLSIISWALKRLIKDAKTYEWVRMIVLMTLATVAFAVTYLFDIEIPRGNITLKAIWLIFCGYALRNRFHVEFNNGWIALACLLILINTTQFLNAQSMWTSGVRLIVYFTGITIAALYAICYLSRKMEGRWLGRMIAICGRESFYIMAFQFLGFKIGTLLLSLFGIERSLSQLTAPAEGSLLLFVYYVIMGFVLPAAIVHIVRKAKRRLLVGD